MWAIRGLISDYLDGTCSLMTPSLTRRRDKRSDARARKRDPETGRTTAPHTLRARPELKKLKGSKRVQPGVNIHTQACPVALWECLVKSILVDFHHSIWINYYMKPINYYVLCMMKKLR